MISKRNTRRRSLSVVNQDINSAECFNSSVNNIPNNLFVITVLADISLNRQHIYSVKSFELFFGILKLFDISACNNKVRTLFCISNSNAVAD